MTFAGNYDACYVHGTSGDEKKIEEREVPRGGARGGLRGNAKAAPRRLQLGVRAR